MNPAPFIEESCIFAHAGAEFEAGGAWLVPCSDGLMRAGAYVVRRDHGYRVMTWHSEDLGPAYVGKTYRGSLGDERQSVTAIVRGVPMYGTLCGDTQYVRLTQYQHVPNWLRRFLPQETTA